MATLKLSSPWVEYYRKINALFAGDGDIRIVFDEEEPKLRIYVNNDRKARAMDALVGTEKVFGNVTLKIEIIPANDKVELLSATTGYTKTERATLAGALFQGNSAVKSVRDIENYFEGTVTYIIFEKEVVQYFDDNLGSYYGLKSTLYEDIAKDVLSPVAGVYYCTSNELGYTVKLNDSKNFYATYANNLTVK